MLDQRITEIGQDRRHRRRYLLDLQLQFRVMDGYRVYNMGTGKTLNMSSSGVAFHGDQVLPPGTYIEISVNWPILLNRSCPLKLVLTGKVVRSNKRETAIKMDRYEFRTQSSKDIQALRPPVEVEA